MKKIICSLLIFCFIVSAVFVASANDTGLNNTKSVSLDLLQQGSIPEKRSFDPKIKKYLSSEDGAYNAFCECLDNLDEAVNIYDYNMSIDEALEYLNIIINTNPQYFYVGEKVSYSGSDDRVKCLYPQYYGTATEVAPQKIEYENMINAIINKVDPDWSDFEKVLFIHDYLTVNFEYDINGTEYGDPNIAIYDTYNFLKTGKGVCQAYALTTLALHNKLGIKTLVMCSDYMVHAWNAVRLDGKWYQMDTTWDDSTGGTYGQASHENFLLSDWDLTATGHSEWYPESIEFYSISCQNNHSTHGITEKAVTPFVNIGEKWYFVSNTDNASKRSDICSTDFNSVSVVKNFNYKWNVIGQPGNWSGVYTGLASADNRLIYNSADSIILYDIKTNTEKVLFTNKDTNNLIYGIHYNDGVISYSLLNMPYANIYASNPFATYNLKSFDYISIFDMDQNGSVTEDDAKLIMKKCSGYDVTISGNADLNGDGTINSLDALKILQFINGWIV